MDKLRTKIESLPAQSKQWWALSKQLLTRNCKSRMCPPIRDAAGAWHRDAPSKAEVLAQSLASKFHLPPEQFQHIPPLPRVLMNGLCIVRTRGVSKELNKLRLNQATGPDKIGAVLLRTLADSLAPPPLSASTQANLHRG